MHAHVFSVQQELEESRMTSFGFARFERFQKEIGGGGSEWD